MRRLLLVSAALSLQACGGGGGGSDATPTAAPFAPARAVEQSDLEIAAAIYSGTARTPSGFYAEPSPGVQSSVATTHVKNTDVDTSIAASAAQFELCTNDWNQAFSWSEASAQNSSQYSDLVATNDDSRYFEFGRMRAGTPSVYVQSRVYKCSYLDRGAANLRTDAGAAGHLNIRPLTNDELRKLSEYSWQFTNYNNFGNVVLKSSGASDAHTLHIARLVRGGMSATCDRIDVLAWRHQVNASTGELTLDVQTLWSFGAREALGAAQLCAH